jgi:chemotaxis protein methyltransferase CheR
MIAVPTGHDLDRFRGAITRQIGLHFDGNRRDFLRDVLQRRLATARLPADKYLAALERDSFDGEFTALARDLTVGETYFFRNIEQFHALAEVVLPQCLEARRRGALQLLSAACASGEEAYSVAIVAEQATARSGRAIDVHAVDINPAALQKARRAIYSAWALRETPTDIAARWVLRDGDKVMLRDDLRDRVSFGLGNLASADGAPWQAARYDVIFCRNVLMYFSPEQMRATVARIADSLAPHGFLFLGHAETLRGVSDRFDLQHSHGTFYYQLKPQPRVEADHPVTAALPASPAVREEGGGWYETIRQASERVEAITSAAKPSAAAAPACGKWVKTIAFELLGQERFAEALAHVRARPAHIADADVLLLEAVLLVHAGEPTEAEATCRQLLLEDALNPDAHYVLALCREQADDAAGADKYDGMAAYLDAGFAMPRLHRGLLAGRRNDRAKACRELAHTLTLLAQDHAQRILLFGGGFSREALMTCCRASLREHEARR